MEQNLSNVKELFKSPLEKMITQTERGNFLGCSYMATDLIRASILHNDADIVMIFEVLESVFYQTSRVTRSFNITDEVMSKLKSDIIINLRQLLSALENNDQESIYVSLRDIRHAGTKFQFNAFHTLPKNNSSRIRGD